MRAQADYARQRYELYKAKAYGPRMTSPTRLAELERAYAHALEGLRFAEQEARREHAELRRAGASPGPEDARPG